MTRRPRAAALARPSAVRVLCEEAPGRVRDLQDLGVHFDADRDGRLTLGLEGGHSRRRIVHAGGAATGRRITRDLSALAATHDRIRVLEPFAATGLAVEEGRCTGLTARTRRGDPVQVAAARAVILATGGMAALWERTTNPRGAVGAGLALALGAGAELADLEFMQFHPTALRHDGPRDGFLITEAVRGEGAILVNARGERFVDELSPRDEVALAIEAELEKSGERAVGLDMRGVDLARFPNIAAALDEVGIDPAREPVPVAPAAHYTMGGVAVDLDGLSSVPGSVRRGRDAPAPGCTARTGSPRTRWPNASCSGGGPRWRPAVSLPQNSPRWISAPAPPSLPSDQTRAALWRHAGLRRDADGLRALLEEPLPLARSIALACLAREESRGAHQRSDRPALDPALDGLHTLVTGAENTRFERWE